MMEVFSRTLKTRGYFSKFKRLKTRDPLSPIPFLLMMEVFTRMLRQMEGAGILGDSRCMEWEVIECLLCFFFFFPRRNQFSDNTSKRRHISLP